MNLPATFLTIAYLIVRTLATGSGFEQSESEDAELAHSMQVRAQIPRFVGKRTVEEEDVNNLLLKQLQNDDNNEEVQKFLIELLKSYDDGSSPYLDDIISQYAQGSNTDSSEFEREAKWAPRFVGKRRSPMFVGRRRAPLFIGKRYAPRFVGKRGAPMFVGRRGHPMFIGRRESPLFVGRRENARPADTSYYVGGKRSVVAANGEQARRNARQTSSNFNFPLSENLQKRNRENLILPQEMHIVNGKPIYSEFSKRFVVPEFVGKRQNIDSDEPSTDKRFDTPFFVGRRSDNPSYLSKISNQEFSFLAQEPEMHSDIDRNMLKA